MLRLVLRFTVCGLLLGVAPAAAQPPTLRAAAPAPSAALSAPARVPGDPLPGHAMARKPLAPGTLRVAIVMPVGLVLVAWLMLAVHRAHASDPMRSCRHAKRRLHAMLAQVASAGAPERARLLHAWQREAGVLWQVNSVAPSAASVPEPQWVEVWRQADAALYGPTPESFAPAWTVHAERLLAAKAVPAFAWRRVFQRRHLWPALGAGVVLTAVAIVYADTSARVAPPIDRYLAGDFAAAQRGWEAAVADEPADWIAQHNLTLVHLQRNRPAAAAVHAAAAFVQQPRHPAVRRHLEELSATATPAALAGFVAPTVWHRIARAASPADWQRMLILASVLASAAFGLLLAHRYAWRWRWARLAALGTATTAVLLIATSVIGLSCYGLTADTRAVLTRDRGTLRSIPTEADTQKTATLPAGALALADRTFLSWVHLAFEDGRTGWVRGQDIQPLWARPAPSDPVRVAAPSQSSAPRPGLRPPEAPTLWSEIRPPAVS